MRIKRGWAVDYGKTRFDVEVDEVDLLRMLTAHGCTTPGETAARMDTYVVFRIMDAEAQAYVAASLLQQEPGNAAEHRQAAAHHRKLRDDLLTQVLHPKDPAASG